MLSILTEATRGVVFIPLQANFPFQGVNQGKRSIVLTNRANNLRTKNLLCYLLLLLLATGFFLAGASRAQAASFAPGCTNGQGDVAALRAAVATANSNGQADSITLAANCRYLLAQAGGGTLIFGADGGRPTTIVGNGAAIDGGLVEPNNVIQIDANARVTINRLTIKGGNEQIDPIYVSGSGLVVNGELTLNDSTVTGNQATIFGGAIRQNAGATGVLTLNNSTVSDNRGPAIVVAGEVVLNNSTLANNAAFESEIRFRTLNSRLTTNNTIIVAGAASDTCSSHPDATNSQIIARHTLVLAASPCGLQDGVNGNRVVSDARLAALTGNPAYQPLSPGSPAIDAGNNSLIPAGVTTDQAGNPRIFAGAVDMGAFESTFVAATVAIAPATGTVNEGGVTLLTVTRSGGSDGASTDLSVPFVRGGTASAADYELRVNGVQLTEDVFVIPSGAIALAVTVTILDDVDAEALESSVFTLQPSAYYNSSSPVATLTIPANDLVVTTLNDFSAAATPSQRQGTLRQALQNANDRAGDDTISFAVAGTITLAGGVLTVNNNGALTIEGNGITVSGNNASTVFTVNTGATARFNGMTIRDGVELNGGGIFNQGNLTLERVTVTANRTATTIGTYYGGGINNLGTLTVRSSTISNNQAKTNGGGISNGGALTVINSTLTGNSAGEQGGGIGAGFIGSVTLINSTVAGNRADISGGGLYHGNGMTLRNVIVADNQGGDCARFNSVVTDVRNSLFEVAGCGVAHGVNGNIVGQDPGLGSLTGGSLPGMAHFPLLPGSAAIDAGNNSFVPADLTLDQAGNPRIFGSAVDLGSYESAGALVTISPGSNNVGEGGQASMTIGRSGATDNALTVRFTRSSATDFTLQLDGNLISGDEVVVPAGATGVALTVTAVDDIEAEADESHSVTLIDTADYNLGLAQVSALTVPANDLVVTNLNDFTNATPANARGGTLRQALRNASNFPGANTITFAVTGVIQLSGGSLRTQGNALTTIEGAGITVNGSGNGTGSVFAIDGPTTINDLTVTGGNAARGSSNERGGGLLVSNVLVINRSTVQGNSARFGGGIYNIFGTVTINHSTIRNNHATEFTGGIWNDEALAPGAVNMTINNSTISGNTAEHNAGIGVWGGKMVINQSAIVDNVDNQINLGRTGLVIQAPLEVNNSILSNGLWYFGVLYGHDCYINGGTVTFRNTLLRRTWENCPLANGVNGNIVGQEPGLGTPIGNPAYYPLNADSPAIDAGDNALIPAGLTTDQAGNPRIAGGIVDMGPVEATVAPADDDNDGVASAVEAGAPNNGDGNSDGIADSQQANVASLPNALDAAYVTLVAPAGGVFSGATAQSPASTPPAGVTLVIGTLAFTLNGLTPGAAADVTIFLANPPPFDGYYKLGATADNPIEHWYAFNFDGATGVEFQSDRIILHLVDGGRGDSDLTANGTIVDPGGPAALSNTAPIITANASAITVDEGETASNSGMISDAQGNAVTLSASVGTAIDNNNGGWSWSFTTSDGPADNQTVTITADDGNGGAAQTSFVLTVNNMTPTISAVTNNGPITAGGSVTISVIASDPAGAADPLSYEFDCNNDGAFEVSAQTGNSAACTFATAGDFPVNVRASDDDGGIAPGSTTVTVTAAGALVGECGGYAVYQNGNTYSAAGWSGAIKVGANTNNTLTGTNGPDLMLGLGGNDGLNGKDGDDVICGGDGVDLLIGGAGHDALDGGAGKDVLNGGAGDHDQLFGGEGNDVLLDSNGVINAQGGPGDDLLTLALRNGWRDTNGEARFAGRLAAGYGNDAVALVILDPSPFFVELTGDEYDDPPSTLEGSQDGLGLLGNLSPAPVATKFEVGRVVSADTAAQIGEETGAEFLSEPVGDDAGAVHSNRIFLPLVNR